MSDKVDKIIDTLDEKHPITFQEMFKSLWGVLSMLVSFIAVMVVVTTWVFNTFPTNDDLAVKYISKAEYWPKHGELKIDLDKFKKQVETDIRKLRLEYRVERMHDLGQQLKIVDDKLRDHSDDPALKTYREAIWKEYNRIRNKIDDGVKEIE